MATNAIRYYSKFGHTKKMVEAVKDIVGAEPQLVSVPLSEPIDTLFLGAGVFLGKVNGTVMDFIPSLMPNQVKRVVCFGSCAIIKSPVPQMRQALQAKGIIVSDMEFTCSGSMGPVKAGHPNDADMRAFKEFVKTALGQ